MCELKNLGIRYKDIASLKQNTLSFLCYRSKKWAPTAMALQSLVFTDLKVRNPSLFLTCHAARPSRCNRRFILTLASKAASPAICNSSVIRSISPIPLQFVIQPSPLTPSQSNPRSAVFPNISSHYMFETLSVRQKAICNRSFLSALTFCK